jgi:hypothetical protein
MIRLRFVVTYSRDLISVHTAEAALLSPHRTPSTPHEKSSKLYSVVSVLAHFSIWFIPWATASKGWKPSGGHLMAEWTIIVKNIHHIQKKKSKTHIYFHGPLAMQGNRSAGVTLRADSAAYQSTEKYRVL